MGAAQDNVRPSIGLFSEYGVELERVYMRKIRDLLRLRHEVGLSSRQAAGSLQLARSTVKSPAPREGAMVPRKG